MMQAPPFSREDIKIECIEGRLWSIQMTVGYLELPVFFDRRDLQSQKTQFILRPYPNDKEALQIDMPVEAIEMGGNTSTIRISCTGEYQFSPGIRALTILDYDGKNPDPMDDLGIFEQKPVGDEIYFRPGSFTVNPQGFLSQPRMLLSGGFKEEKIGLNKPYQNFEAIWQISNDRDYYICLRSGGGITLVGPDLILQSFWMPDEDFGDSISLFTIEKNAAAFGSEWQFYQYDSNKTNLKTQLDVKEMFKLVAIAKGNEQDLWTFKNHVRYPNHASNKLTRTLTERRQRVVNDILIDHGQNLRRRNSGPNGP